MGVLTAFASCPLPLDVCSLSSAAGETGNPGLSCPLLSLVLRPISFLHS